MMLIGALQGADAVLASYEELERSGGKKPEEFILNLMGYQMLNRGDANGAVKLFLKNVQAYPESSNVYDSLGEAYAAAGKKDLAIENYEKSLKLDPKNKNAEEWLKKLKEQK